MLIVRSNRPPDIVLEVPLPPAAVMRDVITFTVPLPPAALRSNARAGWREKVAAKQRYSAAIYDSMHATGGAGFPWEAALVTFVWCYAGVRPDAANIPGNCKALLDIIGRAPDTGKLTRNGTTYLGILEDDRRVELVTELEKVAHREQECVRVKVERR